MIDQVRENLIPPRLWARSVWPKELFRRRANVVSILHGRGNKPPNTAEVAEIAGQRPHGGRQSGLNGEPASYVALGGTGVVNRSI